MTDQPKGSILVVDDEEPIGELMTTWLGDDGYRVRYASSFEQVRQAFDEETFDLVTLDIIMPETSGLQILQWIRENHPDTGAIMATALGDLDTVLEAMRAGAVNYLLKPFNLELVSTEVERAMERQRLIEENRSYQRDLEAKVAEQTVEIRAAHAELESKVRELEGRDRLVQCQMAGPTEEEALDTILTVVDQVLGLERAAVLRQVDGAAQVVASADFALATDGRPAPLGSAATARALQSGDPAFRSRQPACHPECQSCAVPMVCQDEVLGVLWVDGMAGEMDQALRRLADQAALTLWSAGISAALDSDDVGLQELMEID